MVKVYLNKIASAVPPHDVHQTFVDYVPSLLTNERDRRLFGQMVRRSGIDHRYSFLKPHPQATQLDGDSFYIPQAFPSTGRRMQFYKDHAFDLVRQALDRLNLDALKHEITHLILTTCTGFYAPGIDLHIINHYGLKPSVERVTIGFMGCQAGITALKAARHIVRSEPSAKVLVLNLELCTLHLQETHELEQLLSFLIFSDGCAASIVSAQAHGLELERFQTTVLPDTADYITWDIGDFGFDMQLSRRVPAVIGKTLSAYLPQILKGEEFKDILYWAIHPGGSSILDAVETTLSLPSEALSHSREVLRRFGNMSSATVMFVLEKFLYGDNPLGLGCAMAFGPGMTIESLVFRQV